MCVNSLLAPRGRLLLSISLFSLLGVSVNFPEGYSNSYPNTAYLSFQTLINDSYIKRGVEDGLSQSLFTWFWSLTLNIWFIGYLVGTFLTPFITEGYGRRSALLVANSVAVFGATLGFVSVVCSIPELFLVSRFVSSTSSGISFPSLILFLQETSSTENRGLTSFLSETTFILCNVLGIAFGMNVIFGDDLPALTGVAIIPAVVATVICIPLKETPKYLLLNKNCREAALSSLIFYQGDGDNNEEILDEMLLEKSGKGREPILRSVYRVLATPHLRTPFFLGCTALQIVVGIWPLLYLSTDMLATLFSEETAQIASLLFVVANFIGGVIGMFIVERVKRRTLLLGFGALNTFSLALYVAFDRLSTIDSPLRWGTIASLILNGVTYGVGLGPIAFFITSELVTQQYRSVVQSMVFAVNTIVNFFFSFATLPAFDMFKTWAFLPLFVVPSCLSLVYLYVKLPETKGREVHDIVDELYSQSSYESEYECDNISVTTCSSKAFSAHKIPYINNAH